MLFCLKDPEAPHLGWGPQENSLALTWSYGRGATERICSPSLEWRNSKESPEKRAGGWPDSHLSPAMRRVLAAWSLPDENTTIHVFTWTGHWTGTKQTKVTPGPFRSSGYITRNSVVHYLYVSIRIWHKRGESSSLEEIICFLLRYENYDAHLVPSVSLLSESPEINSILHCRNSLGWVSSVTSLIFTFFVFYFQENICLSVLYLVGNLSLIWNECISKKKIQVWTAKKPF